MCVTLPQAQQSGVNHDARDTQRACWAADTNTIPVVSTMAACTLRRHLSSSHEGPSGKGAMGSWFVMWIPCFLMLSWHDSSDWCTALGLLPARLTQVCRCVCCQSANVLCGWQSPLCHRRRTGQSFQRVGRCLRLLGHKLRDPARKAVTRSRVGMRLVSGMRNCWLMECHYVLGFISVGVGWLKP